MTDSNWSNWNVNSSTAERRLSADWITVCTQIYAWNTYSPLVGDGRQQQQEKKKIRTGTRNTAAAVPAHARTPVIHIDVWCCECWGIESFICEDVGRVAVAKNIRHSCTLNGWSCSGKVYVVIYQYRSLSASNRRSSIQLAFWVTACLVRFFTHHSNIQHS